MVSSNPTEADHPWSLNGGSEARHIGVLQSEDRRKSSFATSYEHIAERSGFISA